jgi:hypothetical protein
MITNDGKEVLSKYLLGQAPSYATHISIGCGASPLSSTASVDVSEKSFMDFEMIRVPISSRGFVEENGVTKISFTSELPTENRYEITEVGLWSAGNNNLAKGFDSKLLFNFEEDWQSHSDTISDIPFISSLGTGLDIDDQSYDIFRANCGDPVLQSNVRKNRKEGPRFLNTSIFMRGDSSDIESDIFEVTSASANGTQVVYSCLNTYSVGDRVTVSGTSNSLFDIVNVQVVASSSASFTIEKNIEPTTTSTGGVSWKAGFWSPIESDEFISKHIHLNSISFNISRNSSEDLLNLSFSLVKKQGVETGTPSHVKILVEFLRNEVSEQIGYAKMELYFDGGQFNNRYKTVSVPISSLITTPDFSSSTIRVARIFSSVYVDNEGTDQVSDDYYIALDGFRIENISTDNPLYKMVGYSPIKNSREYPVIKFNNTNNYVEFRFGIGVT